MSFDSRLVFVLYVECCCRRANLMIYLCHLGKPWSTTMLFPVGTSGSTGKTMWELGSTSLPARPGEELVIISLDCHIFVFSWVNREHSIAFKIISVLLMLLANLIYYLNLVLTCLFLHFLSKTEESCEDFPEAHSWTPSSSCPWTDPQIQHEGQKRQGIFSGGVEG